MMRLECACGRKIAAPDAWLGKRVKCPQCGQPVLVMPADAPASVSGTTITREASVSTDEGEGKSPAEHAAAPRLDAAPTEPPSVPPARSPRLVAPPAPVNAEVQSGEPYPEDDEDDFETKQARFPRFLGVLAALVGLGAAASCWTPQIDTWTLYVALAGVALATLGFGVAMSRHRIGLSMPLVGLFVSLLAMVSPFILPLMGKAAPAHYVARAERARQDRDDASNDAQSRGVLSVESIRLTGNKDSLAPEVEYKLINKSGKVIRLIVGSIQLADRDHHSLGGLSLNLAGPIAVGAAVQGKNVWTMEDATQSALADRKADSEYKARQVVYADGTVQNFTQR